MDNKQIDKNQGDELSSISGCLLRIFWSVLGPVLMFLCACVIGTQKLSFPSTLDMVYGIILVIIIIARFIDRPKQKDQTAYNSAIRYIIIISIIGIAVWALARFILIRLFM
jgi:small-conductance mechanosensitive channel